jgi:hypothetical protein
MSRRLRAIGVEEFRVINTPRPVKSSTTPLTPLVPLAMLASLIAGMLVAPVAPAIAKEVIDVFVTNTAANPVPATIIGTPSVSIAGTPTVSVTTTRTPLQGENSVSVEGNGECQQLYAVPAGKRLTVEYVNVFANFVFLGNRVGAEIGTSPVSISVAIPMQVGMGSPFDPSPPSQFIGSQVVKMYAVGPRSFQFCGFVAEAQGDTNVLFSLRWAGYIEDTN